MPTLKLTKEDLWTCYIPLSQFSLAMNTLYFSLGPLGPLTSARCYKKTKKQKASDCDSSESNHLRQAAGTIHSPAPYDQAAFAFET